MRGIAPERGSYSRIGACPYLPPQLINSRCCPCKGRISWAGLAPQYLSRYEPLTGARFINRPQEVGASPYPKYEPPSGALAPQVRDIRAALRGLKAQQVRSPGQRPGLTYVPHLRPVRAKAINNRCAHAFALTGRRALCSGTQGVAMGWELAALSGRSRRFRINRIFATELRAAPQFDVGLRRRNNEFNELTNCRAARAAVSN